MRIAPPRKKSPKASADLAHLRSKERPRIFWFVGAHLLFSALRPAVFFMKSLDSRSLALLAPLLLGTLPASARGRHVVLRPSLVPPVSRPVPFGTAIKRIANAQLLPETTARAVELQGDALSISLGDVVLLPFTSVTRIITEDDEIARAYFQNGSPVLQGVATGVTNVEIYQASSSPRVLTITVGSATGKPKATPEPVPTVAPFPIATPIATRTPAPLPTVTPEPEPTEAPLPLPTTAPEPFATPLPTAAPTPSGGDSMTPPVSGGDTTPAPDNAPVTPIAPARSSLSIALRATPTTGNPGQTTFFVDYRNPGPTSARGVVVRFALDERVSYVTDSASNGGQYDPARREVKWNIGNLPAGFARGQLSLRVEPIERGAFTFTSQATIEDATGDAPIPSAQLSYSTTTTPLLTVFALPDRFLAAQNKPRLNDVSGTETEAAVTRLQYMGVVTGRAPGLYEPAQPAERAEYAVMTLNGLNLRDLRDVTQIKFVLSRHSTVSLGIENAAGVRVADLIRQTAFEAGEHTVVWNGKTARGFVAPGRYTYICTARDARGQSTTLRGTLQIVSNEPLPLEGMPTFLDVKPSDWFARYLAVGEKQGLVFGFPDKTFRPRQPISRVEATAIVVRALGLSDVARRWSDKDVGFLDYAEIPKWARGDVNVATTLAKTAAGRPMLRGTTQNTFEPNAQLRRDQAALIVQRLIDRETTRRVRVSGSIVPGAVVSINSRPISADGNGTFSFDIDQTNSAPTTLSVVDTRGNAF